MRTWIVISLLVFVLFTIVLTILFSEPIALENPVTGMNVKVQEGNVRVSSASERDTVHAGEIARIGADGRIRKEKSESPVVETTADADIQAASSLPSVAFSTPEIVMSTTDTQVADPSIERVTKDVFYIAGYVQNEEGDYLANSQITCQRQDSDRLKTVEIAHSNPKGYYIFQVPEPGDYEVRSSPVEEEYFEETQSAQLTETKKDTALFFVHRRGALTFKGRVIAQKGSEPIAGAKVILIGNDQSPMAVS